MKVGIINIGLGNIGSVVRAVESLGCIAEQISIPQSLHNCDKIILPGVGNFGEASKKLVASGFWEELGNEVLSNGKHLLGICLGMQLLALDSEEGNGEGLGFLKTAVIKLKVNLPLPHVGWNDVFHEENMSMFAGIPTGTGFYFVHSYALPCNIPSSSVAHCNYGQTFAAAVQSGRIWGTQFHPEKSQVAGLKLMRNFLSL